MKTNFTRVSVIYILSVFPILAFANQLNYVPGEVIVKLKGSPMSVNSKSFLSKAGSQKSLEMKASWKSLNMYKFASKPGDDMERIASELAADANVEYAEPNYIFGKGDNEVPNQMKNVSTRVQMQSYFSSSGNASYNQATTNIRAQDAWNSTSGSARPIVAIIDTGVDIYHEVFTDWCAIWKNTGEIAGNRRDDDGNGYIDDINGWNFVSNSANVLDDDGHGTHVAGIVLGTTQDISEENPTPPVSGVCSQEKSKIQIMVLKFLDANGSGTTSDAIQSIYYAVDNGAQILNNSWGGPSYSKALHEAVAYAYSMGTIFVAAAGNSGTNNDVTPMYPASYNVPNLISVAAANSSDRLASFSNYGTKSVHIASPGVGIYSTVPNDYYAEMSGTSMAAPFVTGVAALMLHEKPNLNGYQAKNIMLESASNVGSLGSYTKSSSKVNALDAVLSTQSATVSDYQPVYKLSLGEYDRDIASAIASGGSGCGMVQSINNTSGKPPLGPSAVVVSLLLLPLALAMYARRKAKQHYNRKYERFEVSNSIKVKIADRDLVASMQTVSMGGLGINVEEMLEKGSILKMRIESPDGTQSVEVQAAVVWTDGKNHGLQFDEASEGILKMLSHWSKRAVGT